MRDYAYKFLCYMAPLLVLLLIHEENDEQKNFNHPACGFCRHRCGPIFLRALWPCVLAVCGHTGPTRQSTRALRDKAAKRP